MIRKPIRPRKLRPRSAGLEARRLGISTQQLLGRSPWMRYAGMVASGDRNSCRRIDAVAYRRKS